MCIRINTNLKKRKVQQEQYEEWKKKHLDQCMLTFEGSFSDMERLAVQLWGRSTDIKVRYCTYIGDGDCSAYRALQQINKNQGPYINHQIVKDECIKHVHKRMGTELRKLVQVTTMDYETKGGTKKKKVLSGRGKLSEPVMEKLQSYCGNAIRDNVGGSVADMKKAIWATFYHCTSTDSQPRHNLCPHGEKTWCFWNRAIALQEKEKEGKDRLHREKEEALGESSATCVSFYGKQKKPKTSFKMPSHKDRERRRTQINLFTVVYGSTAPRPSV
ncbi:hypothetical protein Pmani_008742 [Petrolisthes manimaculis]|uniref:Mutator-like transposase domain-containing protein n=1 Tax=Petrolisthes manimaculis TaxID=1843537 RepID=A0AAE1UHH4_9EUCA|nr:hypothetical protein Pmani_008742 [Petrolisthes manimaculis]